MIRPLPIFPWSSFDEGTNAQKSGRAANSTGTVEQSDKMRRNDRIAVETRP
jgi:hypothetical protein